MNNTTLRLFRRIQRTHPNPLFNTPSSKPLNRNNLRRTTIRHNTTSSSPTIPSRLDRLSARLPRYLQSYLTPLRNAPLSHVSAFLFLHELTAILPLVGLAALFHYTNWLPTQLSEGEWVQQGVKKWGRYARRKGWVTDAEEEVAELQAERLSEGGDVGAGLGVDGRQVVVGGGNGGGGGQGVRIVLELGTAWAVTKALLPVRLAACVWGTPWFARVVCVPVWGVVRKVFGRGNAAAGVAKSTSVRGTGVPLPKSLGGGS